MSIKKRDVFNIKLDPEEQEIEDALPDTWKKLPFSVNQEKEIARAKKAATSYMRKDAKINIKLTSHDVEGLKRLAVREGLPYQTLISSILHKYITYHLEN